MNKGAKTEAPTNQRNKQGTKLFQDASVVKELSVHPNVSNHHFLCV
jgi:ABC-type lipopolysaccharide export system ATPase subunit